MLWKIIIVLGTAIASYFIPTPQEFKNAFTAGQTFYASGNYIKAIEQFDYIINEKSPFLSEDSVKVELFNGEFVGGVVVAAYYQKANSLKHLDKKYESIDIFRIVEQRQDEPQLAALAQFQIYDFYYRSAIYDSAITEATKLYHKYPRDKKAEAAIYDIGWAYRELKDYDKSNLAFTELLNKYPTSEYLPRALYQLGQNNYDQRNFVQSRNHWEILYDKYKPDAFKNQDWENVQLKAVKDRKVFEASSGRETDETVLELVAKAQVKIGDSYREEGEYDEAIQSYKRVVKTYSLLPALVEVSYVKMADYTKEAKGLEGAIDVYREGIDENFSDKALQAKFQYKIAEMYQNNNLFDKAAVEYEFYIRGYQDVAATIEFDVDKAQYSIAAMYFNGKEYEKTIAWVDSLLNYDSFSEAVPGALFLKGSAYNSIDKFKEAREVFEKMLKEHSTHADAGNASLQIGYAYYREKEYEKAIDQLLLTKKEYSGKVDESQLYFELMNVYYEINQYDEAVESFNSVKFGSPYYTPAFGKMTKIYGSRSEYERGEAFLDSLLKLDDNSDSVYYKADIYFAFADLNISKTDYNRAIKYLTEVIEDKKLDASRNFLKLQAKYARGVLHYQLNNYNAAVTDLESLTTDQEFAQRFASYEANITEKLALAYSKTGKKDEALSMINRMIDKSTEDTEKAHLYSVVSSIYFEAGDYNKAIESARNVINQQGIPDETKISSYITLSQAYKSLDQLNKAGEVLFEASEKYPNSPEIPAVLYSLAALYFDSGEYDKAADLFNKFIVRYPENPSVKEAIYFRSYAYYESGNWQQAYNSYKQYAAKFPQDPLAAECQYFAGEAMFNAKDYNKAIAEYKGVYQRFPNSTQAPQALYNEGWAYFELQQTEKMIDAFKRLASRYPTSPYSGDGLFTIGDYYYNLKDYKNAAMAYEELIVKFPSYTKVEEAKALVYDLSQINSYLEYEQAMKLFDNRKYEEAIKELIKLYEKYPDASIAVGCQVNIAASYEMLEKYRDAAKWYKQIIDRYTGSKDDNERSAVMFAKEHLEWIEDNYL
jgi:tetratricopeptide (TPR) repeat protein